jgi:O-antigen/teichoic acid export membrane protein
MNLAWNILTTLSARVATLALALVSSIVLGRMLGPEGCGLFALVLLVPEMAKTFGLLGFEQSNAVYAGLEPERCRALVWQSAALAGVGGGVIAVACMWYFSVQAPGSRTLVHGPLWIYLLPLAILPARMLADYWGAILRGMNRILLLNLVEVGTKVASLILVVVLVGGLRLSVAGAVWADVILNVGAVALMVGLLMHVGAWGRPSFDWAFCKRTARFALPSHCGTVLSYLNYRVDQIFIAALLPPEQLGFYVIAVAIAERLWILTGAVATALLPHLANLRERDPVLPAVIARHVMIWTAAACLPVFLLADAAVRLLYSSAFAPAAAPLKWLLPGILTLAVGKVLVAEILVRKKVYYTLWVSVVAAVLNGAGNLVLIPRMGISGAALASSVSYSVVSCLVAWYYVRETGVSWTALLPCRDDLRLYGALWRRSVDAISVWGSAGRPADACAVAAAAVHAPLPEVGER